MGKLSFRKGKEQNAGRRTAAKHIDTNSWTGRLLQCGLFRWMSDTPVSQEAPDLTLKAADFFRKLVSGICRGLKLDRLLRNSFLLRPGFWLTITLLLLPFLPTVAVLLLAAAVMCSVLLTGGMARAGLGPAERFGRRLYAPGLRLVGLLAAIYLLAAACSVAPSESLKPALLIAFFMLFAFSTFGAARSWTAFRRSVAALCIGAVPVSLYGFWQFLHPQAYISGWLDTEMFSGITMRVYSTFQNPNVLGEYFLLVIPFALALAVTAANRRNKLLWGAGLLCMCLCAVLTYSRGCYIGLILELVVFLVLMDRRFLIPVLILALLSPLFMPASIVNRLLSIGSTADTSTNYRVEIWMGVFKMLKQFWFSGVGPGEKAFGMVYPLYQLEAIDAPHAHCLYLQLICDTGISGLLVFLLMVGSLLRSLLTSVRHARMRGTQVFAAAGTASVCGFLLQSLTDYSFYNYRVLLVFFAVVGLCLLLIHERELYEGDGFSGELALSLTEEKRPMVLQILSDSNLGGAGRYLLNLFAEYDRESFRMVLVLPTGGVVAEKAAALDIPVIEAELPGEQSLNPVSILELRRICQLLRPELVQTHGSLSGRIAARATDAGIIYTRHSVFPISPKLKHGPRKAISLMVNNWCCDLALAVSPAAAENLRELGIREKRIVTVMNGVKQPETEPQLTKQFCTDYHLNPELFTAGIFARLESYKGHDTLLDAAKLLKERGRHIQLVICGTGPCEEHIVQRIAREQLSDTVFFCGYQSRPADAMKAVSVQLNASTGTEATSLALVEGMALGIPAVASSYGGTPYLIHDGVEGLLFQPGSAEQLADCLCRLMDDPALCETLGSNARESYLRSFTAEAFTVQLQQLYHQMLKEVPEQ